MLILTRRPGETVMLGDDIQVTVLGLQGRQVRLGFKAPEHIPVHREEIYNKIQRGEPKGGAQDNNDTDGNTKL